MIETYRHGFFGWGRGCPYCTEADHLRSQLAEVQAQFSGLARATKDLIEAIAGDYAPGHHVEDCPGDCDDHAVAHLADAAFDLATNPSAGTTLPARMARLERFAESFATTAEAAVRHHETKGQGGQSVAFHGDFAHVPPSVVRNLRWWAREARAALAKDGAP